MEVEISSVDALAFRIRTGIITGETLLYDSAVDEWGPAGEHPVFRFVKEEGEGPWSPSEIAAPPRKPHTPPARPRPPGRAPPPDDAPSAPPPRARRPGRAPPLDPQPGNAEPPSEADAATEGKTAPDPSAEDASGAIPSETRSPKKKPTKEPSAPDLPDLGGPGLEGLTSEFQDTISELSAESRRSSPPPPRKPRERPEGSPWAELMPQPRRATRPAIRAPRRVRKRRARNLRSGRRWGIRWYVVALSLLPVAAVVLLTVGEAQMHAARDVFAGAVGIVSGGDSEAAEEADAEGTIRTAALTAEPPRGDEPEADGATASARAGAIPSPTRARVEELTAAVYGDLAGAVRNLQASLGVPEAPPAEWLHGNYLAHAGDYPEVGDYWASFRAYIKAIRSTEAQLYRGFVQNRVLEMGLDPERSAALSARAMERFRAAQDRREALYSDLLGLAVEAKGLHRLLVEREASIAYEPFTRQGLSRDPVVEAVPEDPELAREVWSRIDGIFDRLDWIQGVRPVSTLRLQQALLSEFELPERAP
ncbi:MAG: hypothetical protein GWM92_11475 [Gemmatimonadetes bacterium]|nr:hypothetical protein [Gemmatimonadota bacterium]NIR79317.1 hypothetical protein [Gemmatimonadota bacterium]NIT87973.1 hypothetical protein [Gemmatimonadota bacterium]NIU31824.1 hypothetical protein [Gemmatimonadota bacterium]NIU36443.1 hypothetical protein [Gemmatimonadota bacterium]